MRYVLSEVPDKEATSIDDGFANGLGGWTFVQNVNLLIRRDHTRALKRKRLISLLRSSACGKAYQCVGLAYAMHHGAVLSLLTDEVATCSGVPSEGPRRRPGVLLSR